MPQGYGYGSQGAMPPGAPRPMMAGGQGGGMGRDRITQALMAVQNPPPVSQMPQAPQMAPPQPMPPQPAMGAPPPMGMPPGGAMPGGAPQMPMRPPMGGATPPMMGGGMQPPMGQQQQMPMPQPPAMGAQY
jgi:hypothetical protein